MADRATLALHLVDDFADWAERNGYRREPTRGAYELLRLRRVIASGRAKLPPPLVFFRLDCGGRFPAAAQANGLKLVRRWIRERRRENPDFDSLTKGETVCRPRIRR